MLTRMQQRRGTAAQWADSVIANTVILAPGEVGLETDTGKFKIGNGSSVWSALSYYLKDTQNAAIYAKLAPVGPSYSQNITGINVLTPQSSTQTPLVVSGIAGQTAVLQRWRDNSDVTLASIDKDGNFTAKGALFNADVNVNANKITNVAAPINPADATNKQYVDDAINGLAWKAPVNLVSTSNYALTGTFPGASIDGHAITATQVGYRVLFTAQTTTADKGIYTLTQPSAGNYEFVRSDDANVYTELKGTSVFVEEGTTYGTSSWVQTNHYLTSFSGQTWVQFNGASQITAGSGMTKTGNTLDVVGTANRITANADSIDIASTYVGQSTITTLGTIATGTWNATTIAADKGGTGQTSYTVGDILYASTTSALSKLASGTTGYPLLGGGAGVAPSYGQIATGALANSTSTTTGVTYAKLQYISAQWRVLGRKTASAGVTEEMSPDDLISMIGQGTTSISISRIPTGTTGSTVALGNHTHAINDLSDVVITGTPQTRQVIKYNGTNWVNEVPSGGISVGSTPPSQPAAGDAWFDSDDGALYVWYDDAVGSPSAQWVQVKSNSALEASILTRVSALESASSTAAYNVQAEKTAAYTLGNGDQNDLLQFNSATPITVSIPTDATYNFPIGTKIELLQVGAGQVTVAAVTPGTTTVNGTPGLKLRAQWSHAVLIKRAANTWVLTGDLAA